jgi:gliding motility-associated-like protein
MGCKYKFLLVGFLCIVGLSAGAQQYWHFGQYLRVFFPNNTSQPIVSPAPATPLYAPYASASITDKRGNLLFYTNGALVYNRNNTLMSNRASIVSTFATYTIAAPHPSDTNLYYIFTQYRSYGIGVAIVDMRLNNGLGNVLPDKIIFPAQPADNEFVLVKQFYNNGYWLIAHKKETNEYHSFKIDADSIYSKSPVISKVGEVSSNNIDYNWRRGSFISNYDGTELLHSYTATNDLAHVYVLNFDKKCGRVSLKHELQTIPQQDEQLTAHVCYSPDYSKIYASYYLRNFSGAQIYQYKNNGTTPDLTPTRIASIPIAAINLQSAPDGNIYVSSVEGSNSTGKSSRIRNPNSNSPIFEFNVIDFSNGQPNLYTFEHFPIVINDTSLTEEIGYNKPNIMVNKPCTGELTTLQLKEPVTCDSFYWEVNQNKYHTPQVEFTAITPGKIPLTFKWFVCGFKYEIKDTIQIEQRPDFNLGNDTFICKGSTLLLSGPINTEKYLWSTGETTPFITPQSTGTFWLRANSGYCFAFDTITIKNHPDIITLLGSEYFLCEDEQEVVKLDAGEGFTTYKWTPTNDATQWVIVKNVGEYFVKVTDNNGCIGSDDTKVKRKCGVILHIPNVFTPNNDGYNDVFAPVGIDVISYQLNIFSRWGQLVFSSTDINTGWDGTIRGKQAIDDVYIYQLTYQGYQNKILKTFTKSGNFTLVR